MGRAGGGVRAGGRAGPAGGFVTRTDQTLHLVDGAQRVRRGLVFGRVADEALVAVPESDVGWRDAGTLVVPGEGGKREWEWEWE